MNHGDDNIIVVQIFVFVMHAMVALITASDRSRLRDMREEDGDDDRQGDDDGNDNHGDDNILVVRP